MKYYTKEWYDLMDSIGTAELFEPVIDQEHYSDEDIENIYREALDKYIEEERAAYDEPPLHMTDDGEWTDFIYIEPDGEDPEDFDPEDYLIGDLDEDGEEHNIRHPESFEELLEYQKRELEAAWEEYENRLPFDEDEAAEEFEEDYRDNLEEPDEDIPDWIREAVDPRLLALYRLPEKIYLKYTAEEAERQRKFDELDEIADRYADEVLEDLPDDVRLLSEDFDEIDGGDYVSEIRISGEDLEIVLPGWDDEGDPVIRTVAFYEAEILEDEGFDITVTRDEDGDIETDCDLLYHELYVTDSGLLETHLLLENKTLKYLTIRCAGCCVTQESV